MRIDRSYSRLSFRKQRRRRSGCMPMTVLLGVLVSMVVMSWNWIGQQFSTVSSQRPENDLMAAAMGAFERGDLDTTIDLTRELLARKPDRSDALVLLARALIYRSYSDYNHAADRKSALDLTAEGVERFGSDPLVLAVHAYALQAAGQPARAAQVAQQALERDPNNALARVARGLAYGGVGSFEIALRDSLQAAESRDWQLESQRAIAISYSDLGDYKSALKAVENAIRQNNRLIPLYFERALYAMQLGDADAATAAYFQVLVYDPDNVKAHLRLCELSSLLRERDAAVNYCEQVTKLAPAWAEGWYHLGLEYFLQGNYRPAQEALHHCSSLQVMQAVPVSERRFECWYLQGQAAEILGDCAGLVATYNEFRAMAADASIQQTWVYPPEGPPGCGTPVNS